MEIASLAIRVDAREAGKAAGELDRLTRASDSTETAANRVASAWGKLVGVVAALGITALAREFIQVSDSMSMVNARLGLVTKSSEELAKVQVGIVELARQNKQDLQSTATLYTRLAEPIRNLGGTTREALAITDAFAKTLRISGASTQEAAAATLQFSQAMASGRLSGDEFRTLLETSPRLMKALAENMKVPIGSLREMAAAGKLTADVVGNALIGQLPKLSAEAGRLPTTVGQAFQILRNEIELAIDSVNRSVDVTGGMAQMVEYLASIVPSIATTLVGAAQSLRDIWSENKDDVLGLWDAVKGTAADIKALFESVAGKDFALVSLRSTIAEVTALVNLLRSGTELLKNLKPSGGQEISGRVIYPNGLPQGIVDANRNALRQLENEQASATAAAVKRIEEEGAAYVKLKNAIASANDEKNNAAAQRIIDAARDRISSINDEIAAGRALSDAERAQAKGLDDLAKLYGKVKPSMIDVAKLYLQMAVDAEKARKNQDLHARGLAVVAEQAQEFADAEAAAITASHARLVSTLDATNAYVKNLRDANELTSLEVGLLGKSETTRRTILEIARIEKGLEEQILRIKQSGIAYSQQLAQIDMARNAANEAKAAVPARIAAEEWQKTSDMVSQSLYDAIIGGGVSAWEAVKRAIEAMVIRPLIQPTLDKVGAGITSLLYGSVANAGQAGGTSGSGAMSMLGNVASLFGAGGLSGALTAGAGWLTGATTLTGALGAAGSLIGTGTLGGAMSGLAMGAGAILPIALPIALLASRLMSGGERRYGAQYGIGPGGAFKIEGPSGGDPNAAQSIASINAAQQMIYDLVGGMGGTGGGQINRIGFETSKYHYRRFNELFVDGVGMRRYGDNADFSNEDVGQRFAEDLQRSVLLGLQAAQLDRPIAEWLSKFDAFDMSGSEVDAAIQSLIAIQDVTKSISMLGGVFQQFNGISIDSRLRIVELTGGFEAFNNKLSGYISNFYSEQERAALTARQIQEAMGSVGLSAAGIDTLQDFRRLMDSLDISSSLGQDRFATLLDISDEFASIAGFMSENGRTISDLSAELPASLSRMADQISANELMTSRMTDASIQFTDGSTMILDAATLLNTAAGTFNAVMSRFQQTVMNAQIGSDSTPPETTYGY